MSLRLRLFLGLAGLVAAMVAAQWWWVRGLTRDLSAEVSSVAYEVSHSVASIFTRDASPCPEGAACAEEIREENVVVRRFGKPPGATLPPPFDVLVTPEGEEKAAHWVAAGGGEKAVHEVKVARRLPAGEEPQEIMIRLDTGGKPGDEKNTWFFSNKKPVRAYLTVLDVGDNDLVRRIPIPNQGLEDKLRRFRQRTLLGSLAILAAGLLLSALVAHRVSAPLRRLAEAAREVGDGALGTQVAVAASGEVGQAIGAFNRMSSELAELDSKTRQLRAREHLGEIGEIARGLAHTLRNPLNALGLSVEELAARVPGTDAGLAAAARRQIRRIDGSVRSFLALASQGGGAAAEVAPGELAEDVALEALQDGGGKVRLDVDVEVGTPVLHAVEPELRAVLQALCVNAVEASPEGGTVAIRVGPGDGPGRVRVEIDDDGPGLPGEVRRRLFTPHLTTKANGSGMGLFLAHRIAGNRYGGRLELRDRPAGGTRAVLELGPRNEEANDG